MINDSDGVDEAADGTLRVAMTAATRVGETLARLRQQQQQRVANASAARAGDLAERMQAEMAAARPVYRGIEDPQWWATARPEDIASSYQTAVAWRHVDPQAAQVEQKIVDEVKGRYRVDVRSLEAGQLGPELREAAQVLERRQSLDMAENAILLAAADRADHQAVATSPDVAASEVLWDSPERREATARDTARKVDDPQGVEAKTRADVAQAKPATEATHGNAGRAVRSRPARGAGASRERQRGLSR